MEVALKNLNHYGRCLIGAGLYIFSIYTLAYTTDALSATTPRLFEGIFWMYVTFVLLLFILILQNISLRHQLNIQLTEINKTLKGVTEIE